MEAYKKTALHLHSLNDSDRLWILGNLQAHQRERLSAMLEELSTLGIPRRPDLVSAVDQLKMAEPASDQSPSPKEDCLPEPIKRLRDTGSEKILRILKEEQPAALAAVLSVYQWPWRQSAIDACDAIDRQWVVQAIEKMEGNLTQKVKNALPAIMLERLGRFEDDASGDEIIRKEDGKRVKSLFARFFSRRRAWRK
jgi:hypothetical protein